MVNRAIPGRWLRHKKIGAIYPYYPSMANNPSVEEVPEEIAFPERFIPADRKGRVPAFSLETPEEKVIEAEHAAPTVDKAPPKSGSQPKPRSTAAKKQAKKIAAKRAPKKHPQSDEASKGA